MIPFNRADLDRAELDFMAQALAGGHISGNGPFTHRAEAHLGDGHGSARALLTTSCTHALEMAALLLELEPGDEVIVPSYTFVTTASAYLLHGGRPVFVDVHPDTLNVTPELVEAAITERTRAICVVHYGGVGAEPDRFVDLAKRHGLTLIEDNAQGLFGTYKGQTLGTFGALSTVSFHETKNITCGEGGALIVNDPDYAPRAEVLREKGTDRSRFMRGEVDKYSWIDVGSSWVLSDILAALLMAQLDRRAEIQSKRMAIWSRYHEELKDWAYENGVVTPVVPEAASNAAHLYHLRFDSIEVRDRFMSTLRPVASTVFHYQSLHLSEVGRRLGGQVGQCPVTEDASNTLVRLPLFPGLGSDDQSRIIDAIRSFEPGGRA